MVKLVLRRLLWMVPTLLAISLIAFSIIQLPPGDYLTSYLAALSETGETVDEEQVAALRARYNLDEPFLSQYIKWLNGISPLGFEVLHHGPLAGKNGGTGGRWASPWQGGGTVRGQALRLTGQDEARRSFRAHLSGKQPLFVAVKAAYRGQASTFAVCCGLTGPAVSVGLVNGRFVLGRTGSVQQWGAAHAGTTYLLVARLDPNAYEGKDRLTVWANPSGPEEGEQRASLILEHRHAVEPGDEVRLLCRLAEGEAVFDDLRIGTTWESVTGPARAPGTSGLIAADGFSYYYNRLGGWPHFKWPDLGMSMEENRPVTELIGERILLTTVISIVTLLFTWAIAVPIGIYSAVRQYSLGDYVFTFLGFIGLATPSFLLALIFMYIGYAVFGVSAGGLFSPAYQNAPWSVAKVVDLFAHIWIPVVIIGMAGTAGLIRVMRANLLDELRKQYVLTAKAKGVPRIRLLLKYPVRVALNPLVSTIGWVLPAIVSGSTITAVVLDLPTIGPRLLQALLNQDMYLAGSMVMLLSLLTVVGTLLSDLLLLWLDPRIRYERKGQ